MTPERIAYHEAGHAVAGHFLGRILRSVSIVSEPGSLGRCIYYQYDAMLSVNSGPMTPEKRRLVDMHILCSLAGAAAEHILLGSFNTDCSLNDLISSIHLSTLIHGVKIEGWDYVDFMGDCIEAWLRERWAAVESLAKVLLIEREVEGCRAVAIIQYASKTGPWAEGADVGRMWWSGGEPVSDDGDEGEDVEAGEGEALAAGAPARTGDGGE